MNAWQRLNRRFLIRYRIEYVVALLVVYGVRCFSPAFAWRTARGVGRLLWRLGVRRKTVLNNLAVAFPEMSEAERDALGRRTQEHFASMVVDMLFQRRMITPRNYFDRIELSGWTRGYLEQHGIRGLQERSRRILFLTGHLGNWELSSGAFGMLGVAIAPVFRKPQNPFLDPLLRNIRLDGQTDFIEKRGAVRAMMEHLDGGGNVGILFDQEAVHGYFVPFFGKPACTHKTPAVLVRDHGLKVFFGVLVRKGDYLRYHARGELIEIDRKSDDRQRDLEEITAELMRRLEAEIRRCPEQYMWMHRRWKRSGVHGAEHMNRSLA